jgi:glycerate-2-kinase
VALVQSWRVDREKVVRVEEIEVYERAHPVPSRRGVTGVDLNGLETGNGDSRVGVAAGSQS